MTYTQLTETGAQPSAEEAAAIRVLDVAREYYGYFREWNYVRESKQNEIFAEIVRAVGGE